MPKQAEQAGAGTSDAWEAEFAQWLEPFLAALPRCTHRKWAPRYVEGLLGPGERKSIERLADQVALGDYDQLHHFLTTTAWDAAPLLRVLAEQAQAMVGGPEAVLIVDDTSLCKQGRHSVGVARQYSGAAGTVTNCQTLVSLTLAAREVPLPIALRLYLPEQWASDRRRCQAVGVPSAECVYKPKWQLALEELDRVRTAGVTFGLVLADADYGKIPEFRRGLSARGLRWAVGIPVTLQVYPATVRFTWKRQRGGLRKRPRPLTKPRLVRTFAAGLHWGRWRRVTWRRGTKGQLSARFAAARVRIGDGAVLPTGWKIPSEEELWLVGERRSDGKERYYLTNLPAAATLAELAAAIKARWVCEQAHQQMKEELGLDHFEGRSWAGLHHHVLLTMIAFAFLQHYRLSHQRPQRPQRRVGAPAGAVGVVRGKNPRATTRSQSPRNPPSFPRRSTHAALPPPSAPVPTLRHHHRSRAA
jgi:SRSO17 transposase